MGSVRSEKDWQGINEHSTGLEKARWNAETSATPPTSQTGEQENRASSNSEAEWDSPVPLDHLPPTQQVEVRQLLRQKSNVFARDEEDVGTIPSLQLKICSRLVFLVWLVLTCASCSYPLRPNLPQLTPFQLLYCPAASPHRSFLPPHLTQWIIGDLLWTYLSAHLDHYPLHALPPLAESKTACNLLFHCGPASGTSFDIYLLLFQ